MLANINNETLIFHASSHFAGKEAWEVAGRIIKTLESKEINTCIIDFGKTDLIDSSGMSFLISLAKEFRTANAQLILKNINDDTFEMFERTGLDRVFTIERNGGLKKADLDLFENAGSDVRLKIRKESIGDIGIFIMSDVLIHPAGSRFFKQQLLLFLAQHKKILLDFKDLTFVDSLSINAILSMNNLMKSTGGSLCICSPNYIVKDLLTTLSIDSIIPLLDKREDALAEWGKNNA